jgi:hypothetical protein
MLFGWAEQDPLLAVGFVCTVNCQKPLVKLTVTIVQKPTGTVAAWGILMSALPS